MAPMIRIVGVLFATAVILNCFTVVTAAPSLALTLSDWIGNLTDTGLLQNSTLLDLSLPGTHDTVTYDLSDRVADNANDLPSWLGDLLHAVAPKKFPGEFIRYQGVTQGVSLTDMLDGGLRYFDFRTTWTGKPMGVFGHQKDWYGMHMVETKQPSKVYMKEMATWLRAHPSEIIVLKVSWHGGACDQGDKSFPGSTSEQRQQLWSYFNESFAGMLFDHSYSQANVTTVPELIKRDHRVVLYVPDWANMTSKSSFAYDGCLLSTFTGDDDYGNPKPFLDVMRNGASIRAANKANNRFGIIRISGQAPTQQIENAAFLHFLPGIETEKHTAACASAFRIPNMTFCPRSNLEATQIAQYYNQRIMEFAFVNNYTFPTAWSVNAADTQGTIHTGVQTFGPAKLSNPGSKFPDQRYAFAATTILSLVNELCADTTTSPPSVCGDLQSSLQAKRDEFPMQTWDEPQFGRLIDWPVLTP